MKAKEEEKEKEKQDKFNICLNKKKCPKYLKFVEFQTAHRLKCTHYGFDLVYVKNYQDTLLTRAQFTRYIELSTTTLTLFDLCVPENKHKLVCEEGFFNFLLDVHSD